MHGMLKPAASGSSGAANEDIEALL